MKILICIDDTDNLESRGTGELAQIIAETIVSRGWGKCSGITRHQLLVHPDIPYTSHNSSMCFEAEIVQSHFDELVQFAADFLQQECAEGSDPGLCVVCLDQLILADELINFGLKAKKKVLTKQEAYAFAQEANIHLSEHGGTGQGVIGALAGTGLRLSGNDGRFKGKLKVDCTNNIVTVGEIIAQTNVDIVKTLTGEVLADDELVQVGDWLKAVLLEGKCVFLVQPKEDGSEVNWQSCTKQQLKRF
jgi:hypothetical protein